jgi:hypothetical protein
MVFRRLNKEEILRKGFVDVKAYVSGLRQTHRLKLIKERSQFGWITILEGRYALPNDEMVRIANEIGLPIRCKDTTVFPEGKMKKDFATPYSDEEKKRFLEEEKKKEAEDDSEDESYDEDSDDESDDSMDSDDD